MKDDIGKYKRNLQMKIIEIATILACAQAIEIGEILGVKPPKDPKAGDEDILTYYPETDDYFQLLNVSVGDLF